ncbi:MAG: hypothetical protein RIT81_30035 [Deltaproteobacteria bacterium]
MCRRLLTSVLLAAATGCGGTSLRYGSGDTAVRMSATQRAQAKLAVVDVMDGRSRGEPTDLPFVLHEPRAKSLAQIRESFRAHVVEAGLVGSEGEVLAAPTSREELDTLLGDAADRGAKAVLFVRLDAVTALGYRDPVAGSLLMLSATIVGILPGIIAGSLTINEERVAVLVRGFLVDPDGRVVVARVEHLYEYYDDAVALLFGYGPADELPEGLFAATDAVLVQATQHLADGPTTSEALDVLFGPGPRVYARTAKEYSK